MSDKTNIPFIDENKLKVVLVTDCGSTTTKAILFENIEDKWTQTFRAEAPTTVEKPVADVTIGAKNAFLELEEISGRKIIKDNPKEDTPPFLYRSENNPKDGIDLYISTSSAGGGLQMIVAGLVAKMTALSSERAALGAGAIVMETFSLDDNKENYERIDKIRHIKPDIILISGGTDGGNFKKPLEIAETILQANSKPRFGETIKLPIIYAGNKDAANEVKELLSTQFEVSIVENLRPSLEKENLAPARTKIHDLFLNHVMSHAPGYKKLLNYTPLPIQPTPAAFGDMIKAASSESSSSIIGVDIGGATTDVFSVFSSSTKEFDPVFNRTVSANLGMSYSVSNVLLETGAKNIIRWLPFEISEDEISDLLRNKMIRPTSIPQTIKDLLIEQAVCREALRLSFNHHKKLAIGLKGTKNKTNFKNIFSANQQSSKSLVDLKSLNMIIGSGGVLSHAPDRKATALILIDAYEPTGITKLFVDSIFMMPHLGVLSLVSKKAANEILYRDCLINLGVVISPLENKKNEEPLFRFKSKVLNKDFIVKKGNIIRLDTNKLKEENIDIEIIPIDKSVDVGKGRGKTLKENVKKSEVGIILDTRGRPIAFNEENKDFIKKQFHNFSILMG